MKDSQIVYCFYQARHSTGRKIRFVANCDKQAHKRATDLLGGTEYVLINLNELKNQDKNTRTFYSRSQK